ncbi:hypothetical protein MIMGU_mgv1a0181802mg, partial [Erythranthe guttata]
MATCWVGLGPGPTFRGPKTDPWEGG